METQQQIKRVEALYKQDVPLLAVNVFMPCTTTSSSATLRLRTRMICWWTFLSGHTLVGYTRVCTWYQHHQ